LFTPQESFKNNQKPMTQNSQFVRMTIRLPIDIYTRLKAICEYKGCTMQEFTQTAITEYLAMEENRL